MELVFAMNASRISVGSVSASKAKGAVLAQYLLRLSRRRRSLGITLRAALFTTPFLAALCLSSHGEAAGAAEANPAEARTEPSTIVAAAETASETTSGLSAKGRSCVGKLGVSRTIIVGKKNGVLVGVGKDGRIGLQPRELVLTFDDGPLAGTSERVLKALADECVQATFFSLGRSARQYPALLRRIASEGHTIATHTHNHPLLTKKTDASMRAEIRRGVNSIDAALEGSPYKASNFFRYPFLDRSKNTDRAVRELGLIAFHMNIDSWDWRKQTPAEMLQLTMARVRNEGSGVVLFHDIQEKTAQGLPEFLQIVKREGYTIVHIVPGDDENNVTAQIAQPAPVAAPKQVSGDDAPQASRDLEKVRAVLVSAAPAPRLRPGPLLGLAPNLAPSLALNTGAAPNASSTDRYRPPRSLDELQLIDAPTRSPTRIEPPVLQITPVERPEPAPERRGFFRRLFGG